MSAIEEAYRNALYRARIDSDKLRLELARAVHRAGQLEQENEALREFAAHLARCAT